MTGSNSNKILTVSYGTFSCTLEGFDDPFGTMRGIAEYFRDLAADDRYFGAEPPTPDVEMLQSIAQREVNRRVEARIGDGGVALTQVTAEPEPAARPAAETVVEAKDDTSGPLAFDDEYLMPDEPEDVLSLDAGAAPMPRDDRAETVAEKLRRIRAVVSRSIEPEDGDAPFDKAPAQDVAGADAPRRNRATTRTVNAIAADIAEDDDIETHEPHASPVAVNDPALGEDADFESFQDDAGNDEADDDMLIAGLVARSVAESSQDTVDEDIDVTSTVEAEDDAHFVDEPFEEEPTEFTRETQDSDDAEVEFEDVSDEPTQPDEQVLDGDDADVIDDGTLVASSEIDSDLGVQSEEIDDTGEPSELEAEEAGSTEPHSRPVSRPLEPISEGNGDVGRLMRETDNKLADGESIRRRRVISQMRAAVAATKADRVFSKLVTRQTQDDEEQTPYRDDLQRVISRTPGAKRPAPLVLVSSQRVDAAASASETPSEPPKPARPTVNERPVTHGFRAFAEDMGAVDLPDLLEAAAAYTAFVEGQPHFSRPEIMKRVARFDPALELSREAGLRSFGQLLRQGKIRKLQRGQFTIAEDTRFNPADRIAGQ